MPSSSGGSQSRRPSSRHAVDEDLGEDGHDQPGNDQRQAGEHDEGERRPRRRRRRRRSARQQAAAARRRAGTPGPGSKVSTTPVNAWSNSSSVTTRGPAGRVVQVDPPLAEALDHQEVVEVPEHDHRRPASSRRLCRLLLEALGLEAVARAALTMLLALLPSRETPQATRSSSSGTKRP